MIRRHKEFGLFSFVVAAVVLSLATTTGAFQGSPAHAQTVTSADVTISETSLDIDEGALDTYTVVLDTQPAEDVTVVIEPSSAELTADPRSLTFTSANWNIPQIVTVAAKHDDDALDESEVDITHTVNSNGDDYDGLSVDGVTVTVTDDDKAVRILDTLLDIEEGNSATYSVVLDFTPTGNVTVAIGGIAGTSVAADRTIITFTPQNWHVEQDVTVSAGQDDDGVDHITRLTHTVTSTDSNYNGLNIVGVTVRVTDDETAGVTLALPGGRIDEGTSMTYAVVLDTQPTQDVTVAIEPPEEKLTVWPDDLIFRTQDWSTPQTVTVRAHHDINTRDEDLEITHVVSGGDYSGVTVSPAKLRLRDDDPGMDFEIVNRAPVFEEDAGAVRIWFSAVTNESGVPTQRYSIDVVAGNPLEDTAELTSDYTLLDYGVYFAPEGFTEFVDGDGETRYRQTAHFDLTIHDDKVPEDTERFQVRMYSLPGADYFSHRSTEVTITDDDFIGMTVEPAAISVAEGATSTYTVVLDTQPSGDVTLTVKDPSNSEVTAEPGSLTFSFLDWFVPQTVTVTAEHDVDVVDEPQVLITHTVSSTDSDYDGLSADGVTVVVKDDDDRGVTISETSLDIGEGNSVSYTVVLDAQPAGVVTVAVGGVAGTKLSLDRTTLTFTEQDWSTPQTVTVTADDDEDAVDESAALMHEVTAAADNLYDGLATDSVNIAVTDDETVGVSISETSLHIVLGDSAVYTVVLDSQPTGDVTVDIGGLNGTYLSGDRSTLIFTDQDWDVAQEINVTMERYPADGGVSDVTITHVLSSAADSLYDRLSADSVTVTALDPAVPRIIADPKQLTIDEGSGSSYTVVLDSRPTTDVTVRIEVAGAYVRVNPGRLTFTVSDWNTPQTVDVTASHNSETIDFTALITHRAEGTPADSVEVMFRDNDVGLDYSLVKVEPVEEDAGTVRFWIVAVTNEAGMPSNFYAVTLVTYGKSGAGGRDYIYRNDRLNLFRNDFEEFVDGDGESRYRQAFYFDIIILDDNIPEETEYVEIVMGGAPGHDLFLLRRDVAIIDDDVLMQMKYSLVEVESVEEDAGTVQVGVVAVTNEAGVPSSDYAVRVESEDVTTTSGGDYEEVDETLVFAEEDFEEFVDDVGNTRYRQTVHFDVVILDNRYDEDAETFLLKLMESPGYKGSVFGIPEIEVTINDNDTAGVTVTPTELRIEEGDAATYTVVLDTRPSRGVTVTIHDPANPEITAEPASRTFTPTNWHIPKTVTVLAAQDNDVIDEAATTITHTVRSTFEQYNGLNADSVTVMVTDDDVPTVEVSFEQETYIVAESDDATTTDVKESEVTVMVTLSADPEREVIIPIRRTNQGGASDADYSGVPASVTFIAGETSKSFTLTAVQDTYDDDGESVKLGFGTLPTRVSAGTTDEATVSITDDDIAGVTVHPTSVTIEEGDSAAYTVVLDTEPTGNVTVTVNAPANTDVTASPASLTFTADGWDRPQEVTVAVTQDSDAEDDTAILTHTVASSTDTNYDGVSADSVAVTVTDDDKNTVFATDASYRILTQYGATTEIVLTDYLADGVSGITFTLDSCDEWRGDYYNSAIVKDERLVLKSNTSGHIHGSNTQPETVCTVTGTGGGRNQEQEFRLYTVSDRTPLPLLPGALSLVEARPSEVDIRISVPQGAQDYLRLGWREIGGQPTFRVVSGVSDGTLLTITGLEQGTEYDVRASLMTLQGFDLYRAGNSGAPLSLIPDGGPGSKRIGNLASGGLGKSQTIRVMSAYRSSLSIADVRESEEVGGMVFEVTLSKVSDDVVTVDWTTSSDTAGTPTDYQAESGTLTFPAGEIVQTLTVTINNDMVDEEEEETFTVTLTNAVNATIEDASATGTIIDDDMPSVSVSFEQGTYTVAEGSTVPVTVTLNADPERTVTIPITTTDQDGASISDYSGVPASITFNAGDTEVDITFTASSDSVDDDGESVKLTFGTTLPAGVSAGNTDEAVVSITDDDTAGITVTPTVLTVTEGGTAVYTVVLDSEPAGEVTVTVDDPTDNTDVTTDPANLTFTTTDWDVPLTVTVSAAQDEDAADETATIGHTVVSDYTDYSGIGASSVTVAVTDDEVAASFATSTYTVSEGSSVIVKVTLSNTPGQETVIPVIRANEGGASDSDYSGIPASLTFGSNDTERTFEFLAKADALSDSGESVKVTFETLPTGVIPGSSAEAVISITDVSFQGTLTVEFDNGSQVVSEGATTTVTVSLSNAPGSDVTIPLTSTGQEGAVDSDYSGVPEHLTFTGADRQESFTFTAAADSDNDDGESVRIGFGDLPAGVSAGSTGETTLFITDDDVPAVTANFEQSSYSVAEGETVEVTVTLSEDPERSVTILLSMTNQGGAMDSDYSVVPESVTFNSGQTEKTFSFNAATDSDNDDGESVKLELGSNLPDSVSKGSIGETIISITDDDVPAVTVSFDSATITVAEGATTTVSINLSPAPESSVTIPLTATGQGGATSTDYSGVPADVTFESGEAEKTFIFSATQDTHDDDDESVRIGYGNLPTGVSVGTPSETVVSIADNDDPVVTVSFGQSTYPVAEGSSVDVKVKLSVDPERSVTIPITKANQGGATSTDYSGVPESVTFNNGETEKSITFSATQDAEEDDGESVKLGFATLPPGVSEAAPVETTVTITDDDISVVTVNFGSATITVAEGATTTVTVNLSPAPESSVTIPLTATGQGGATSTDYSGVPADVTFESGEAEKTFIFSATQDTHDDDDESVRIGYGNLPTGVSVGTPSETVVSITDNDDPVVTVSFGQSTYTVAEGERVELKVKLSAEPERTVTIQITRDDLGGATSTDYSGVPDDVTFNSGDTEKTFSFNAAADSDNDDGESVRLGLSPVTQGVTAGSPSETTVSITDDDISVVTINFGSARTTVAEGATTTVSINLSPVPESSVTILLTATDQGGATPTDYSGVPDEVTFESGDTEKTFIFSATQDTVDDDDESVKLGFESLPTGVTSGTINETVVSITPTTTCLR